MIKKKEQEEASPPTQNSEDEFGHVQFDHAFTTIRAQFTLVLQLATAIVIADATFIGLGINNKMASIIMIAAIFPLTLYRMWSLFGKTLLPMIYVAINLENRYKDGKQDWLTTTFSEMVLPSEILTEMKNIANLSNSNERISQLKALQSSKPYGILGGVRLSRLSLILGIIGHIVIPVILVVFGFGWKFF